MNNRDIVLPTNLQLKYILGKPEYILNHKIFTPFNAKVLDFLVLLSQSILSDHKAKQYPDVISFGYWCRKSNIKKIASNYPNSNNRVGVGVVFHIAPSNVPVNFAFSYVFSLLSGNVSIVRIPTKDYPQIEIISSIIFRIFENPEFVDIRNNTYFIRYEHNESITSQLSSISNARILWGSDKTVDELKSIKSPSRSLDISFSERYSFAVIDAQSIISANESELKRIVDGFYNDTYLMDQNACSSPQLVFWVSSQIELIEKAKSIFWNTINFKVKKEYDLAAKSSIDKLTQMCLDLSKRDDIKSVKTYSNYIYNLELNNIPLSILDLVGKFGYFYEYAISDLGQIVGIMDSKIQTLTYYGIEKSELYSVIYNSGKLGVDRIVPIGSALDIGIVWDGYDMIYSLTRVIDLK